MKFQKNTSNTSEIRNTGDQPLEAPDTNCGQRMKLEKVAYFGDLFR
jgi:hypothetical protein